MFNLFIGIIVGFFCGVLTGIITMCFATAAKINDSMIKEHEKEKQNMKIITTTERETTWADLKEAAKNHTLKSGDKIPITLKNGEDAVLVIGHDQNGKAYFVFEDCINEEHYMNESWTNKGGWEASDMRKWLNSYVYDLLPDEIQKVIVPTTITQIIDKKRSESENNLFLLSKTQVFGKGDYSKFEPEDTQIDIFAAEKSRVKERGDHGTWFWWLGSPYDGSANRFCSVGNSGGAGFSNAGISRGVAPSFCISES